MDFVEYANYVGKIYMPITSETDMEISDSGTVVEETSTESQTDMEQVKEIDSKISPQYQDDKSQKKRSAEEAGLESEPNKKTKIGKPLSNTIAKKKPLTKILENKSLTKILKNKSITSKPNSIPQGLFASNNNTPIDQLINNSNPSKKPTFEGSQFKFKQGNNQPKPFGKKDGGRTNRNKRIYKKLVKSSNKKYTKRKANKNYIKKTKKNCNKNMKKTMNERQKKNMKKTNKNK
jgi:hypothetical protein